VLVSSACGAFDSDSSGEPELGDVVQNPSAGEIVLPLDGYLPSGNDATSLESSRSILVAECVADQGYDYPVLPRPPWVSQNLRRYGLVDEARAAQYGFGNPPDNEQTKALLEAQADSTLPQNVFVACITAARKELGTLKVELDDSSFVYELSNETWDDSEADSRVQEAFDEWKTCMQEAGYPDAGLPLEFSTAWITRRAPSTPSAGGDETVEPPATPADGEIAAAIADVRCKQEVNLAGIWWAVETAYQNRVIEENSERMRDIDARLDVAIENAAEVLATGGGAVAD
jgi:hypothetical protein